MNKHFFFGQPSHSPISNLAAVIPGLRPETVATWVAVLSVAIACTVGFSTPCHAQSGGDAYNATTKALMEAVADKDEDRCKALTAATGVDVNAKTNSGLTVLIIAIFLDESKCAEALISAHADVNAKEGHGGNTALMTAAKKGNIDIVKALIAANADVNAKDNNGEKAIMKTQNTDIIRALSAISAQSKGTTADRIPAIFKAAQIGDLDTLKQLIGDGTVDIKMADGATPLFDAAMAGRINVLTWLLDKGANVNSSLPDGTTALHLAIGQKQLEACRILIEHKANLNDAIKKPDSHLTPLLLAIDRKDKDIALLLINSGADVNLPTGRGYVPDYPLEQAAWPEPGSWAGQEDVIAALLVKGAKSPWLSLIREFDSHSLNALTPEKGSNGEALIGSMPFVMGIVPARRNGALPPGNTVHQNLRVIDGQKGKNFWRWGHPEREKGPLTVATVVDERGNKTQLQLIPTVFVGDSGIAYSENVSAVEASGPFADVVVDASADTAKVTAVRGNGKVIPLIRSGSTFKTTLSGVSDYESVTVVRYATGDITQSTTEFGCVYRAAKSGTVIYHVLPAVNSGKAPAFWGEIHDAAKNGDLGKVTAMIQADPTLVFKKDSYGATPLHWAAMNGHTDIAQLLIANRADVNVQVQDGATPLITASVFGHMEIVQLLLANGSDVKLRNNDGMTALHAAADKGYKDIVELLLANHADANSRDTLGMTPLHYAAGYGHMDVAVLLLANGADVNATNFQSATPLRLAEYKGHQDIAAMLRQHGGHE
jgi:ankyrin repeat protein